MSDDRRGSYRPHRPMSTARHTCRVNTSAVLRPSIAADPPAPPRSSPRLAVLIDVRASDTSFSLRDQWDRCMAEVVRLGGTIDPASDVYHDFAITGGVGALEGWAAVLRRIRDDRAYDGVVVDDLPSALGDARVWSALTQAMHLGSCDLHVASMPQLSLWTGLGLFGFGVYASVAQAENIRRSPRGT